MEQQEIYFSKYPDVPGFREKGGTSQEAANDITSKASTLREMCYNILEVSPHTADEIADIMDEDVLSIRPRISELFKQVRIEKTAARRASSRGKSSIVWRVI